MRRTLAAAGGLLLLLTSAACGEDPDTTPAGSPRERADALVERLEALDGVDRATVEFYEHEDDEGYDVEVTLAADVTQEQATAAADVLAEDAEEVEPERNANRYLRLGTAELILDGADDPASLVPNLLAAHAVSGLGTVFLSPDPSLSVEVEDRADIAEAAERLAAAGVSAETEVTIHAFNGQLRSDDGLDQADADRWVAVVASADLADGYEVAFLGLGPDLDSTALAAETVAVRVEVPGDVRPPDLLAADYRDLLWPMLSAQLDVVRELGDGAALYAENYYRSELDTFLHAVAGPDTGDRVASDRGWNALAEDYLR